MNFETLLTNSEHDLSLFTAAEIESFRQRTYDKDAKGKTKQFVRCLVRDKEIQLKPEEIVRQLYLEKLTGEYGYPKSLLRVEYPAAFGNRKGAIDVVILDKDDPTAVYIAIEIKKAKRKDGVDQLKSYFHSTGSPIGVWTNGKNILTYRKIEGNKMEEIGDIPKFSQTLADIINKQITFADLVAAQDKEEKRVTLKEKILDMEDRVLANAGVDAFEEVFKLIFTKLYDEIEGIRNEKRNLEFRNTGQTDSELYAKIQELFNKAKGKWEGIFGEDEKIKLTRSHLAICVSALQNEKLFNSNLEAIDDAFEYLVNKSAKGDKGQYFTPRYVIDMCVKMLNPREEEFLIDTAAGSAGFTIHSILHVWKQIFKEEGRDISHVFTAEKKGARCEDYVQDKVFAIDFDEKSVRVARTLNLIAGDGETNVLKLNTLDYRNWNAITEEDDWKDVYYDGFRKLRKLRAEKDSFKDFQFDVLMANPPFAGDLHETQIITHYELAKKANGNFEDKVGRDILFIERNLDFLKAGGRMAIVLPQGRFNNSSDKRIREFIAERCRILAVVGLHGNTFKPHTGTKTSVLFVQKWNDDANSPTYCPRTDDYNIFFATQRKSAKDNSGEKIYRKEIIVKYYEGETDNLDERIIPPVSYTEKDFLDKYGSYKQATIEAIVHADGTEEVLNHEQIEEKYVSFAELEREAGVIIRNLKSPIIERRILRDAHHHDIVEHDLFNVDDLTEDGIAEAFVEFGKKEKLSFFV